MTRRYLTMQHGSQRLELVLGYDRPLDLLFVEVHAVMGEGDDDGASCLYDSLAHPELDWTRITTLCQQLRGLGLRPPAEMLLAVWTDQVRRAGNLVARHHPGRRPEVLQTG